MSVFIIFITTTIFKSMRYASPLLALLGCLFFSCKDDIKIAASMNDMTEINFNIPEGFVLEELYQPSTYEQGSWVAMTQGNDKIIFE